MNEHIDPADLELYLLRHADAGDPEAWSGPDGERPLSEHGRRQAAALGQLLAGRVQLDAAISSPKLRARQTAELVCEPLGMAVEFDDRLGGRLDIAALTTLLGEDGRRRVMLVGHDPDFSELTGVLVGSETLFLSKGALARIDLPRPFYPGHGRLRWLIPPDVLAY